MHVCNFEIDYSVDCVMSQATVAAVTQSWALLTIIKGSLIVRRAQGQVTVATGACGCVCYTQYGYCSKCILCACHLDIGTMCKQYNIVQAIYILGVQYGYCGNMQYGCCHPSTFFKWAFSALARI